MLYLEPDTGILHAADGAVVFDPAGYLPTGSAPIGTFPRSWDVPLSSDDVAWRLLAMRYELANMIGDPLGLRANLRDGIARLAAS